MKPSTIDVEEVARFAGYAKEWWSRDGALRTLHDINPTRLAYMEGFVSLKGQRVLDIGCGGGILSEGMAKLKAKVTGLDVEPQAIAVAAAHALEAGLAIDYVCQPLESYVATPFPIITCLEMLEHVASPKLILEHTARLLAPSGYLFLSTINRTPKAYASVVVAAEYVLGLIPKQTHDYQRFIKPSELAAMVRSLDLEVVGLSGLSYNPVTYTASLSPSVDSNYLMVCRALS